MGTRRPSLARTTFLIAAGVVVLLASRPILSPTRDTAEAHRGAIGGDEFLPAAAPSSDESTTALPNARSVISQLPARFERIDGRAGGDVAFVARGYGHQLLLSCDGAVLAPASGDRAAVRMRINGSQRCDATGEHALPGTTHYFIGDDPSAWRTGVRSFERARFDDVYPGIDLVYYGTGEHLEYDFIVSPGASARAIELSFAGVDAVHVAANGDLVLDTDRGELRQRAPVVYQDVDGERRMIAARYARVGQHEVAFEIGEYDALEPLVIDPVLVYSTYLGGFGQDEVAGAAADPAGNLYIYGLTQSTDLPGAPPSSAARNHFVMKLTPDGRTVLFTTLFGATMFDGAPAEFPGKIVTDAAGNSYVSGYTNGTDLPTVAGSFAAGSAPHATFFVFKIAEDTGALVYTAKVRQTAVFDSRPTAIAVDTNGQAYAAVSTTTRDLPTPSGFQANCGGFDFAGHCPGNAYLIKLNAAGSALVYGTYLGGSSIDQAFGLTVDSAGLAYLAGTASSSSFPLVNAFQSTRLGHADGFVSVISTDGSQLLQSTLFGGNDQDQISHITLDANGDVIVAGTTLSLGGTHESFPITLPPFGAAGGSSDAFIARLRLSNNTLQYSRLIGNSDSDSVSGLRVDGTGAAYIAGSVRPGTSFPNVRSHPAVVSSSQSGAFTMKLNAAGTVVHNVVFGSDGTTGSADLTVNDGVATVFGTTFSQQFVTMNPIQAELRGFSDAYITQFDTRLRATNASPRITSTRGGETIAFTGRNFASGATVKFGDSAPIAATVISPVSLTVVAPARSEGSVAVVIANPDGETAILAGSFEFSRCAFTLTPQELSFGAGGGTGAIDGVGAEDGCSWSAVALSPWLHIIGATSGTAPAHVTFSIDPNRGDARTGLLLVGGREFTVHQSAAGQFTRTAGDFTGDGTADLTVFRPGDATWITHGFAPAPFGMSGDVPVAADYNGDGITDRAVFQPSTGTWLIAGLPAVQWGLAGDVPAPADYNGDGAADVAVFRPSTGRWYVHNQFTFDWGRPGDLAVAADYSGDGRAEIAVFRPSTGRWWIAGVGAIDWGITGDIPVPADYNGDGITDVAVYRPSTGVWYVRDQFTLQYGLLGDVPVPLDLDGDGRANVSVYRPSSATWFIEGIGASITIGSPGDVPPMFRFDAQFRAPRDFDRDRRSDLAFSQGAIWTLVNSAGGSWTTSAIAFGLESDIRRVADVDGDGRGDLVLFRESSGLWYVALSSTGFATYTTFGPWGTTGDTAVPADYDGDGRADIAVYRPSTGRWYIQRSSDAINVAIDWGLPGDLVAPADYDGDGSTDLAVFRPSANRWYVRRSIDAAMLMIDWGTAADLPAAADYDGDGRADVAVFRPSTGEWWIRHSVSDYSTYATIIYGANGDTPIPGDYNGDGFDEPGVFRPNDGFYASGLGRIYTTAAQPVGDR